MESTTCEITSPIEKSRLYQRDFHYLHDNPYHDRLSEYQNFVLRDHEAENFKGQWNSKVFKNEKPLFCEIGSGYGHFMREYCQDRPDVNFVGIEHRFKRTYELAKKLAHLPQFNFRYLRARGERLQFIFGENELDGIFYFFPDPWPKNRHHKKRLFQAPFLEASAKCLKPGGHIFVKTDHHQYFEWMCDFAAKQPQYSVELVSFNLRENYPEHFLSQYVTKFEKIFIKQNVKIKALVLKNT